MKTQLLEHKAYPEAIIKKYLGTVNFEKTVSLSLAFSIESEP